MKILIADKFEASGINGLTALGCEIIHDANLKDDALIDAIRASQADVLVVRSTKVTAAMLSAGKLSLVVRAGAGYNTIDVKAASALGIFVSNCPGKNAVAVAELAFALILALDRRIVANVVDLQNGKWDKAEYSQADGVKGKTIGLIGLGQIGSEMIPRAQAFGLHVIGWGRSLTPATAAEMGIEFRQTIAEVANERRTTVLYEAPHRVQRTVTDLLAACGPDRRIALARELTKLHEETWRGKLAEAVAHITDHEPRGEFVVIIAGASPVVADASDEAINGALRMALAGGADRRTAIATVTAATGATKRRVYDLALTIPR